MKTRWSLFVCLFVYDFWGGSTFLFHFQVSYFIVELLHQQEVGRKKICPSHELERK